MENRYGPAAVSFHWLAAVLILAAFPLGLYMAGLPVSPLKLRLYSYHKWIGVTVFCVTVARLAWRLSHAPPPPVPMPAWQRIAAESVHHLLYALTCIIPVTGWLMSSAKGFQTVWFGVLPLPDLVPKDEALGELFLAWHRNLNFLLASLVAVHVAAVLKHQLIDKDGLLRRMSFRAGRGP